MYISPLVYSERFTSIPKFLLLNGKVRIPTQVYLHSFNQQTTVFLVYARHYASVQRVKERALPTWNLHSNWREETMSQNN